jgi:hypothetical protein
MENKLRPRLYIGIDCGVNTGIAIWNRIKGEFVSIETCSITQALFSVKGIVDQCVITFPVLIVEDPSVWFWKQLCIELSLEMIAVPVHKRRNTKLTPDAFASLTGWKGRTSNHARDAAMLVFKM